MAEIVQPVTPRSGIGRASPQTLLELRNLPGKLPDIAASALKLARSDPQVTRGRERGRTAPTIRCLRVSDPRGQPTDRSPDVGKIPLDGCGRSGFDGPRRGMRDSPNQERADADEGD
jgi:hypothetical protein